VKVLLTPADCMALNEKMQKELSNLPARFTEQKGNL